MVYLDSNVFIYAITHDPDQSPKARGSLIILKDVERGKVRGVTSVLTWDEVTWVVWKLVGFEYAVKAGMLLIGLRNLSFFDVNRTVMLKAQELLERYELRPRDALHVSTALASGEKEIVSDDSELDVVREMKRITIG